MSDDELKRLFKLTESVTNTLRPSLPRQTLYARSYKLKVKHLRYIIAKWEFQGRYYNESIVWVKMTDSLDPGDFVFIRYIRITHRTGIQRCFEDNKNRTFGLLPAFLRSLDDLFESRQESCTCHEFVDGSLEDVDSTGAGDLREKSLIALFGHPSLLNKQHGGFLNDCVPSNREESLFLSLETNAFQLLDKFSENAQHRSDLQRWAENMQAYANDNPEVTDTSRMPFSDEYRNQVITRGLPVVMAQKLSALLVFREHVPMKEMIEVYGLWVGGSAAATLLKNCLSRLSAWENDRSVPNEGDAKVGDA